MPAPFGFIARLFGVAMAAFLVAEASSPRVRQAEIPLSLGAYYDWSGRVNFRPVHLHIGRLHLIVSRYSTGDGDVGPQFTWVSAGQHALTFRGNHAVPDYATARIGIGRWDRAGHEFVMLQSSWGGAHCCNHIQLLIPDGATWRMVDMGQWEGNDPRPLAKDVDGDGRPDFVLEDDDFDYRFGPFSDSVAPLKILNVVNGRVVDVSTRRSFVPLFRKDMVQSQPFCVDPKLNGGRPNGACAAFVASAIRAGEFDRAWKLMLHALRKDDPSYPMGCRVRVRLSENCPHGREFDYGSYPAALRGFLVQLGYLER